MVRKNYIFIDRENVREEEFDRIGGKPAYLTILFGPNQKSVPLPVVRLIRDHAERIEIIETPVQGKNALDFILAYEIGRRAEQDPSGYFHIIAKDGGYDALLLHLKSRKIHASRRASLAEIPLFMNRSERASYVVSHFRSVNSARPGKRKALENALQALFARTLDDEELQYLVDRLVHAKVLTIGEKDQVTYSTAR
ncbi:PIN domain-containing protein [Luteolibacter sp. GHJ8]|uniref:PIN domain-containing protein n=1 Tax=Luteolibacter rhizosphaerae TaxID=2989719 RepID=A0ABT3G1B7_9BACT|nr:PIN domain-containing protein [Luteolibacter rhizosphaerae]MCW1913025.1 PIN domain-containing protein [Luteolibacter rhizosphaerae]